MSVVFPINPDDRFEEYTATAAQTVFSVPFPFQDNRDITVIKIPVATGIAATLTLTTDYSLTGAGTAGPGSMTLVAAAAAGDKFRLIGSAVLDRLTSIVRDGRYSSRAQDDEHDRHRLIQQELAAGVARSIKADYGQTGLSIDTAVVTEGKALMRGAGNTIAPGPTADEISAAQGYAEAADAARIAAETALADFNAKYLGVHASDAAATASVGGAPEEGAIYWNSTSNIMRVWNATEWDNLSNIINDGDVTKDKLSAPLIQRINTVRTPENEGVDATGSADSAAALAAVLALGPVRGTRGAVYRIDTPLVLPNNVMLDLNGATLKLNGDFTYPIIKAPPAFTTTTVASGFNVGASAIQFTSVAGFAIGDGVFFDFNGGVFYAKITNIVSTTVTLDREVTNVPWAGLINATKEVFYGDLTIANGIIDCSALGANSDGIAYATNYRSQFWDDLEINGLNLPGTGGGFGLVLQYGRTLRARNNRFVDYVAMSQMIAAAKFDDPVMSGNLLDGDGFGLSMDRCCNGRIVENTLRGRYYSSGTGYSVRGIKMQYGRDSIISHNIVNDMDSGLRFDEMGGSIISDNVARRCGVSINVSNTTANGRANGNLISTNTIHDNQNVTGAIYSVDTISSGNKITANVIQGTAGDGIRTNSTYLDITDNKIIDYDQANTGLYSPIVIASSSQIGDLDGNYIFSNNPATTRGIYVDAAASEMKIGRNAGNLAANRMYHTLPAPPALGMRLEPGGLIVQTFDVSTATAWTLYNYPTAFPHGLVGLRSVREVGGSGAPGSIGHSFDTAGSSLSQCRMSFSGAGVTARITVEGY